MNRKYIFAYPALSVVLLVFLILGCQESGNSSHDQRSYSATVTYSVHGRSNRNLNHNLDIWYGLNSGRYITIQTPWERTVTENLTGVADAVRLLYDGDNIYEGDLFTYIIEIDYDGHHRRIVSSETCGVSADLRENGISVNLGN